MTESPSKKHDGASKGPEGHIFGHQPSPQGVKTLALALGALGVVYGDIGTSPLYTIKECFHGIHGIALNETNILGVLSLVFWSLTMVVSLKYVTFILRADNKGEGGIYALLALIPSGQARSSTYRALILAGIFGASLLFGESIITPAISVLSAIEGLEVATKAASPFVLPLTCVILFLLFIVQRRGTAHIGNIFGPIMILWFGAIGVFGALEIIDNPRVIQAVNPVYALSFFAENGFHSLVGLGSVVLCITGSEALYADLGHFGRKAIRLSWLCIAFPMLLLNYFGQGALLLQHPELAYNPFFGLVSRPLLYPMVVLSTAATVIASQAMITGIFSLTQQAIQLGYFPRLHIIHTSHETRGQIYVPQINYALMVACIGLVLIFGESSRLAAAYGISVTATMCITSTLYFFVLYRTWSWSFWKALPLVVLFLVFDVSYFGANLLKIADGGWVTVIVALAVAMIMITWRDGRAALARAMLSARLPMRGFLEDVQESKPQRVMGTAVFMTVSPVGTPSALLHFFKHAHVLHDRVVLLSISSADVPTLADNERLVIEELGHGFFRLLASFGFMETPNVPAILALATTQGLDIDPASTTYFLGRETLLTTGPSKMKRWRKSLFAVMSRNAQGAMSYFGIPTNRVVELGVQIEL